MKDWNFQSHPLISEEGLEVESITSGHDSINHAYIMKPLLNPKGVWRTSRLVNQNAYTYHHFRLRTPIEILRASPYVSFHEAMICIL